MLLLDPVLDDAEPELVDMLAEVNIDILHEIGAPFCSVFRYPNRRIVASIIIFLFDSRG